MSRERERERSKLKVGLAPTVRAFAEKKSPISLAQKLRKRAQVMSYKLKTDYSISCQPDILLEAILNELKHIVIEENNALLSGTCMYNRHCTAV